MKPILLIALFLLLNAGSFAQFAIVQDAEGFVNVRSEAKAGNNILDTLLSGHLVYPFEEVGNWATVYYNKGRAARHGYVYANRLKPLTAFERLPIVAKSKNRVQLLKGNQEIVVVQQPFDSTKHRYNFTEGSFISKIDGQECWGIDGSLPSQEYRSITVRIKGKTVPLPATAFKNLFNPNLEYTEGYYDKASEILYITSRNSDGAGGYIVVWKIAGSTYTERLVDHGF
jgi:hypothetical protein